MKNKFKIIDESGDRKYFTIIPNYIINHSTVYEQAIYLYMKRIAGENSSCWSSAQNIANKLGCSRNTVAKYRNFLVKRGWLKIVGNKQVGATNQKVIEYKIVDLWSINSDYYKSFNKVSPGDSLKVSPGVHKEDPLNNKEDILLLRNNMQNEVLQDNVKNKDFVSKEEKESPYNINHLITLFSSINLSYKLFFKNKTERLSLVRLCEKLGYQKVEDIIKALLHTNQEQYAPIITSPYQLETKLANLIVWHQKRQKEKNIIDFSGYNINL